MTKVATAKNLRARSLQRDRMFYGLFGIASLAAVFVGFSRTYFLNFTPTEPLPTVVRIHAVLFTAWVLLFIVQTSLVAARRTSLHRTLGIIGMIFAVAILVSGYLTAIEGARTGWVGPGQPRDASGALTFLAVPIGDVVLFGSLLVAGFVYRRQPEIHKRIMVFATIMILPPAFARLPVPVAIFLALTFTLAPPLLRPACSWSCARCLQVGRSVDAGRGSPANPDRQYGNLARVCHVVDRVI